MAEPEAKILVKAPDESSERNAMSEGSIVLVVSTVLVAWQIPHPGTKPWQVIRDVLLHEYVDVDDLLVVDVDNVQWGERYVL